MTDIEPRLSDVSGTTNEAVSDEDNIGTTVYTIEVECDVNKDDFMTRYYYVANKLRKAISYFERNNCGEFYAFDPVLIAEDVDPLVLDELPTLVAGFHVKSMVRNRCLYVISLSNGLAHGTGVIELGRQVSNWSQSRFAVATDASMKFGNEQHGRAPDVLVQVHATNLAAGVQRCRLCKKTSCIQNFVIEFN